MPKSGLRICVLTGGNDRLRSGSRKVFFHKWFEWDDGDGPGVGAVLEDENGNIFFHAYGDEIKFLDRNGGDLIDNQTPNNASTKA